MDKRKNLFLISALVLAAGAVSGAYIHDFGQLKGEVEVTGPTFYASEGKELLINEKPDDSGQTTEYFLGQKKVFYNTTDELDNKWYSSKVNMTVEARVPDGDDSTFELNLIQTNSTGSFPICDQNQEVTVDSDTDETYSASCEGDILGEVQQFDYMISSASDDNEAWVKIHGRTKVELIGQ